MSNLTDRERGQIKDYRHCCNNLREWKRDREEYFPCRAMENLLSIIEKNIKL